MLDSQPKLNFIRWFDEIGIGDVPLVGGKNASLGEMCRELGPQGINLAYGFAVTAQAYREFLQTTGLDQEIKKILSGLDSRNVEDLQKRGLAIRHAIMAAELPEELKNSILSAYQKLCSGDEPQDVAVRSSATAEDLPDASFAGQQETYLNVRGEAAVLDCCQRCFASLFTDRAISYRVDKGYDHFKVALSIGVQQMVRSDLASSGVMFSLDTETGFRDVVLINAAYGLGENVVQGTVNPDEFTVFKPTLKAGFRPILQKKLGTKEFKLVYDAGGGRMTRNVPVPPTDRARFAISDEDILTLARWTCLIEDHYSRKRNAYTPMDIEWAKDGISGKLFILQARPETVQSQKTKAQKLESYRLLERGPVLTTGRAVGERIASGKVRVVESALHLQDVQPGEILVTDKTDPDWEPVMKKAAGIVTNRGGRTCHAAIVSREMGLPAIVGTEKGTEVLRTGQEVTISCAEGEIGNVYQGRLKFEVQQVSLEKLARPKTKIMLNVGNPSEALRLSSLPNDGVGLAREEFIITTYIKIHPQALLNFAAIEDVKLRREIDELTAGYEDKSEFFVDKLAAGVAMI
ncbi:MAG: phosphoenolpyruvate synthase, partial [Planctomycetales bacterium]|nr:phosphoenolpyruvate synthase [Planctomycetales bacterium]